MTAAAIDPTSIVASRIADECRLALPGVRAVIRLLREGATVPFIARYRKEPTGGLDEVQIRTIEEKNGYYVDLGARRRAILAEIASQGLLTPDLEAQIESSWVKAALEDLYLPFKPKRRTRASMARERGLEPLADRVLAQPTSGSPDGEAAPFVDASRGVPDTKAALAGARDIVAERIAERRDVRAYVRGVFENDGVLKCEVTKDKAKERTKFETYYDFRELVRRVPSHRFLAIHRGEAEGVLRVSITIDDDAVVGRVAALARLRPATPFAGELGAAIRDAVERLLHPSLETAIRADMKLAADRDAVAVFAENLRRLLLAPPLGRSVVIGIDPGQRTGCKCVVVDDTGKLVEHTVLYLVSGDGPLAAARDALRSLLARRRPFAIAVGNGTHGRETADFCRDVVKAASATALVVLVSEAGASVYSASDVAREEFPDLDLTVRGAVSIARRLQDPLSELVKIDPKAIGVGQYQHDVQPQLLARKLEEVVETCVNGVGVELNTASAELLSHVAGVGPALARRIVKHRDEAGAFRTRKGLLDVPGLGPKAFEQCAGFVRVRGGDHPLDASAVHPERYALVARIVADASLKIGDVIGRADVVAKMPWAKYVSADVGLPTLEDIQRELVKPGRDPRAAFEAPPFRDDVRKLEDLARGMDLEGVVTNVTVFGAFVDVGVHQDGLVHVSQLADRFVANPHEVVSVGQRIKVRVLDIDLARKRIGALAALGEAGVMGTMDAAKIVVVSARADERIAHATRWLTEHGRAAEVLLVGATAQAVVDLSRSVAHALGGAFGWHRLTLTRLAWALADVRLAESGRVPVSSLAFEAVCARVVHAAAFAKGLGRFAPIADRPGLPRALARTFTELRLAHVHPRDLGDTDLAVLFDACADELGRAGLVDPSGLFAAATEVARQGHALLGRPILLLDVPIATASERELLRVLFDASGSVLCTAAVGDDRTLSSFRELGLAFHPSSEVAPRSALDRLTAGLFAERTAESSLEDESVTVFSAPGESRECVEIVRRIHREAERGVAFDRMAVILRSPLQYRAHVQEAFRRGGIPAHFARGTMRPDPAGRAFLALLTCASAGLSATGFAEFLSLGEVPDATNDGGPPPSLGSAERWVPPDAELLAEPPRSMTLPKRSCPRTINRSPSGRCARRGSGSASSSTLRSSAAFIAGSGGSRACAVSSSSPWWTSTTRTAQKPFAFAVTSPRWRA